MPGTMSPIRWTSSTTPFPPTPTTAALPYAEIEIRQDLLADEDGIAAWCERVEQALVYARRTYQDL